MSGRGTLIRGAVGRATYGVIALAIPKLITPGGPGISEEDIGVNGRYFNRLFGGRDLVIAALTIGQVRGGRAGAALATNVACELTDSISLAQELRARGGLDQVTVVGLLFNVFGYLTWLKAAAGLRASRAGAAATAAAPGSE